MADEQPSMWCGPSVVTEPQPNAGPLPSPPAAPPHDPLYSDAAPTSMPTLPNLPSLPSLPALPELPALPALPALPPAPEEEKEVPAPMPRPAGGGGLAAGEFQQIPGSRNTIVINTGTAEHPNNRVINIPLISSKPEPRPEDMFGPAPPPSDRGAAANRSSAALNPAEERKADPSGAGSSAREPGWTQAGGAGATAGTKLFLGGLNYDTEEQGLRAYFGKWGTVLDCLVLRDKLTEKSRGFGFVTLVEEEAVDLILKELTHEIDGRNLTVRRSTPRGTGPLDEAGQPKHPPTALAPAPPLRDHADSRARKVVRLRVGWV